MTVREGCTERDCGLDGDSLAGVTSDGKNLFVARNTPAFFFSFKIFPFFAFPGSGAMDGIVFSEQTNYVLRVGMYCCYYCRRDQALRQRVGAYSVITPGSRQSMGRGVKTLILVAVVVIVDVVDV